MSKLTYLKSLAIQINIVAAKKTNNGQERTRKVLIMKNYFFNSLMNEQNSCQ